MFYSIRWERFPTRVTNVIKVRITFLDEEGQCHVKEKYYKEWIGVVTSNISKVIHFIREFFPGHRVFFEELGEAKKILPYFEDRLARGQLHYRSKPFFKILTSAPIQSVGRLFNRFKFSYYSPEDWLVRIYIDLSLRFQSFSFYYKWYELKEDDSLLQSLVMKPERQDPPDWTFAAFDLESVPLEGKHIPIGYDPSDRIVMISVYKWNRRLGLQKRLLYLLPQGVDEPLAGYPDCFQTESEMLVAFHQELQDAQILTGYNINGFDLPCLFARCLHLGLYPELRRYKSIQVGTDVVVTYGDKMTLDLYAYIKTFSGHDLPSFKLDDVARIKLGGEAKLPVKATGIWSWYLRPLSRPLFEEQDVERCFALLQPEMVSRASDYGSFRTYLDYCLQDSELVYQLFEKEMVLSFLVERSNFTSLNAMEALHLGNSRYLLELFKTYGTRLGYFINLQFFKVKSKKTYQGALNYCVPGMIYEDVSVMDFASMYPSTLLSSNLCYGTCKIMSREEWESTPSVQGLTVIPCLQHGDADFEVRQERIERFSYPPYQDQDYVIVISSETPGFLPNFVSHFLEMRKRHQREWKRSRDVIHFNAQLAIKILVNSLYGVMASKDSVLAYPDIAIAIVTLSRLQLLGTYHYLKCRGYVICYADTDSLMVHRWLTDDCEELNAFLGIPHVELKFEQRMRRLFVLSKKRYVYESADGKIVMKGFQKKVNGLTKWMSETILRHVWQALFGGGDCSPSAGWILWADVLQEANFKCRDPKRYSIYRKVKKLEDYVSTSCPSVKYLKKYPEKTDEHVEFTYCRVDVAESQAGNAIVDVDDCNTVNLEQLFKNQKRILCLLLNMAYWKLADPMHLADFVLNNLNWKRWVHAELMHFHAVKRRLCLLLIPGVEYTFVMNNHFQREGKKGKVVL